jgi:hypothetical protein
MADAGTFVLLLLLPEDLITRILLHFIESEDEHGLPGKREAAYMMLRQVRVMFRRFCDSPEVLLRLSLREFRDPLSRRPDVLLYLVLPFEDRFHLAGSHEVVCYEGMVRLMTRRDPAIGLVQVNQAAVAGDSGAAYFLAMLRYRQNPKDPEALALLQGISGGPSLAHGRWENHGLKRLRYLVWRDLCVIAQRLWLPDGDDVDLCVEDPHVCTWAECRRWWDTTYIIRYCSAECRINHEYVLWTRQFLFNGPVRYSVSRIRM